MALSLDKHVMSNPALSAHVDLKLDFSGFFKDWKSTNVSECQTSSLWSECQVNTYHLCAQVGNKQAAWWKYSACMFAHQYPHEECAGPNPWANATCTPATFPKLLATVSDGCAAAAGLDAAAVKSCVTDGKGVELLKASNKKTVTFPTDKKGYPEPEWVQVQRALSPPASPAPESALA
jgi:hypothetical protein